MTSFGLGFGYSRKNNKKFQIPPTQIRQFSPYHGLTMEKPTLNPPIPAPTTIEPIITTRPGIPQVLHHKGKTATAAEVHVLSLNPLATRAAIMEAPIARLIPEMPKLKANGDQRVRIKSILENLHGHTQNEKAQGTQDAEKRKRVATIQVQAPKSARKMTQATQKNIKLAKSIKVFDDKTRGKPILSHNEGRYVKKIKKACAYPTKHVTLSLVLHETATPVGQQLIWIVTALCSIYTKQTLFKNSTQMAEELGHKLRMNPHLLRIDADNTPQVFDTWGAHTAIQVQEPTNGAGSASTCSVHLIQQSSAKFSNFTLERNFLNRTKGVKDMEFSREKKPKRYQSAWAFLTLEDAIQLFLIVREFDKKVQGCFIRDNQQGYLAYQNSSQAFDTVFCLSASSFKSYATHLNSLAEFCLLINQTWYIGTNFEMFQKTRETHLDGHWVLDQIIEENITPQLIKNWVLWLCGKQLCLSAVRTKLAGVSFFFSQIQNIRIADSWSLKSIYPFVRFFNLDRKNGADYANPMIRTFLICDILKTKPQLKHMVLPCIIANLFGPRPNELLAAKFSDFNCVPFNEGTTIVWTIPKVKNCLHAQVKKIFMKKTDNFSLEQLLAEARHENENHNYVCSNEKGGHMTYRIFARDLKKAVVILKIEWKQHSNNDISDLKFTAYTFRISIFNDLFFQGYTAKQIITLSGHASEESLKKSYLCHADSIWSNGLSNCFSEALDTKEITVMFENLTNLSIRNIKQKLVTSAVTDTVVGDQTSNAKKISLGDALDEIFPEIPEGSYGLTNSSEYEFELFQPWGKLPQDKLQEWEAKQSNLAYKPSEIYKSQDFQSKVFLPIYTELMAHRDGLIKQIENLENKSLTEKTKTLTRSYFTKLADKVAEKQISLLTKFIFRKFS